MQFTPTQEQQIVTDAYKDGYQQGVKQVLRDFLSGKLDKDYILSELGEELNDDDVIRIGDSLVTECGQYGVVDFIDGEYVGVTWNKGCHFSECTSKEHLSKVTKVKTFMSTG